MLYIRRAACKALIVGVYVDGLIITGPEQEDIDALKREMTAMFRMSDLGLLSYYLGIEVEQSSHAITLCQSAYARKLLANGEAEAVKGQHRGEGRRHMTPQHRGRAEVPDAHAAGHLLRRGLCEPIHGVLLLECFTYVVYMLLVM